MTDKLPTNRTTEVEDLRAEVRRLAFMHNRMLYALKIADLHLSISDDKCYEEASERGRCLVCLGCSVDMARIAVRAALTEAGSGPL